MGYALIEAEDLECGEAFAGFAGAAEVIVIFEDTEGWSLDGVLVKMRRDGEFVWERAPDDLAKQIRHELYNSDRWIEEICAAISASHASEVLDRRGW